MIMTVRGEIRSEDLGAVAMSEHILYALAGWEDDPRVTFKRAEAVDALLDSLREFKRAGGRTLVDSGGLLLGRDVELLANLSSSEGIRIVASTGIGQQDTIPGHFRVPQPEKRTWMAGPERIADRVLVLDKNHLAGLFFNELVQGMVASGMRRTQIKAGIVVTGASRDQITGAEEISIRGAALAAKRAGVAVLATGSNQARRQMQIMLEEGLEPGRIILGHCDDRRAIDLERDKEVAKKGAYVAYDHIGWEDPSDPHSMPDEQRVELVKAMVQAGFGEHVVLSCSSIGHAVDVPQPKHFFSHLWQSFVPKLRKAGLGDPVMDTLLHENPRRILTRK